MLVTFAVIVTNRQFSENGIFNLSLFSFFDQFFIKIVIKCWVPAYFTLNYEVYANQICWVSNTYYTNQTQILSKNDDNRKKSEIKYYQWIPVSKI